jgi:hypothetical protein
MNRFLNLIALSFCLTNIVYANIHSPIICSKSKAPLFQVEYRPIEIELKTDFDKINEPGLYPENAKGTLSPGTLNYFNQKDKIRLEIKVDVRARGGYRFEECDYRPLKVEISKVEKKRINQLSPHNIFKKLGRKLKFVTICSSYADKAEEEQTLLKEMYVYKIFSTFSSTSLNVRLVKLKMIKSDGSPYLNAYAFIREPTKRMTKRCGLTPEPRYYERWNYEARRLEKFTIDENGNKVPYNPVFDRASVFKAELYNQFIRNDDYSVEKRHNMMPMVGAGRECPAEDPICQRVYLATYDYDLGFVVDGGLYTTNYTTLESAPRFKKWIKEYKTTSEIKRSQLRPFLQKKSTLLNLIESSAYLGPNIKKEMLAWLNSYIAVMEHFLQSE